MNRKHEKELFKWFEEPSSAQPAGDAEEAEMWETELGARILRLQDDAIEKEDFLKLQKQLLTDARALEYYIEFMQTFTELHFLPSKKQEFSDIRSLLPV
jgi:hypothetical protein